jgi:hypothetical protein
MSLRRETIIYWIGITIILFMLYRHSIFPGVKYWPAREAYFVLFAGLMVFLVSLDSNVISKRLKKAPLSRGNFFNLLFLLIICFSILFINPDELASKKSLLNLASYGVYVILYFFILPSYFIKDLKMFYSFLWFFSNIGLLTAFIGVVFYFMGVSSSMYMEAGSVMQIYSYIVNPNYVSFLFTNTTIITFYLYLNNRGRISFFSELFLLVSLSIQLYAQVFTFCRAGLLGNMVGMLILMIFYFRRKVILFLPFVLFFGLGFLYSFFAAKGYVSFLTRFFLLIPAYHMLNDSFTNFLWGFGPTTQFEIFKKYILLYIPYQPVENPHNFLVSLLLMYGLIFTSLFLVFLVVQISKGISINFRNFHFKMKFMIGFLISVSLAQFIHGLFDSGLIYYIYFNLQFFLIYLGLLAIVNRIPKQVNSEFLSNNYLNDH